MLGSLADNRVCGQQLALVTLSNQVEVQVRVAMSVAGMKEEEVVSLLGQMEYREGVKVTVDPPFPCVCVCVSVCMCVRESVCVGEI